MAGTTLGTAYVQIVPSAQGIKGSISNVLGGEAQSAGLSIGGKIGAFAKKALVAAGVGTLMVKGLKAAMSEGAKLQQSYLGGLDTLYGKAAESARKNAQAASAYGISMNEYSEQAVSFGAALKNAYGGDVVKAAKAADSAIKDMADNQAKMGTDIGSIQMAYQGFAKQNYTMLDNLKLGYGGTRGEMERLLADASKLSGVEYNIDNLGDVYEAIHVIQGELGLTGVAAEEASTTFSGSFAAMKAAAANFFGSLALGQGVKPAMQQLVSSVGTFLFKNLFPMVGRIIKSLPAAIVAFAQQGLPMIFSGISSLITSLAAQVTTFANSITGQKVKQWATTTLPKIAVAGAQMIGKFVATLIINLPKVIAAIGRIGAEVVKGLGSAIWGKVTKAANGIKDRFLAPINTLKDKVKAVIDKIKKIFPVSLGKILNFSIPTISVSGGTAPWGIGGKGKKPSFSVSWEKHALGGIFTKPTFLSSGNVIHEFGERGREAIIPLDPFWKRLDNYGRTIAENREPVVINIYESKDPRATAQEVKRILIGEVKRESAAWR